MQLTHDQLRIIASSGDIKIQAVAGSGKTTTLLSYAASRPAGSKILYLAFNRQIKEEARNKLVGITDVKVVTETAHSLAYKEVMTKGRFKLKSNGYSCKELIDLLGIKNPGESQIDYLLANHVKRFFAFYCNHAEAHFDVERYKESLPNNSSKRFVQEHQEMILKFSSELFQKMKSGKLAVTHDFYLKLFQLSEPQLKADYILFDEGQDASAVMLDVVTKQKAIKVIAGDYHQQIYSWRFVKNAMRELNFPSYSLSSSFRFNQAIALTASKILEWKRHLNVTYETNIIGQGPSPTKGIPQFATLARTNLGLVKEAINFLEENPAATLHFEGNISTYFFASDGTSIYDVLNVYNKRHSTVKDALLKKLKSFKDLEHYANRSGDSELVMVVELVKSLGNKLYSLLKKLRQSHLPNERRLEANRIFSTVHRCKGAEYEHVYLADDFISEQGVIDQIKKFDTEITREKIEEEINLLYVAVTRAKKQVYLPYSMEGFVDGENLFLQVKPDASKAIEQWNGGSTYSEEDYERDYEPTEAERYKEAEKEHYRKYPDEPFVWYSKWEIEELINRKVKGLKSKFENGNNGVNEPVGGNLIKNSLDEKRKKHPKAYTPWSEEDDTYLSKHYLEGETLEVMSNFLGRSPSSLESRLKKLFLKKWPLY